MSRSNLGTINPDTTSGTTLATNLTAFEAAWLSGHSNTTGTRPTYAVAKTIWVDDSATPWIVKMYDGTDDIVIGTIDATTNKFIPGVSAATAFADLKQAASTTVTGVVELSTQAEADNNTGGSRVITSDILNAGNYSIRLKVELATTSGTTKTYSSIPAGTKKITIMFAGVSTSGTSIPIVQIGDSGGIETTGYVGATSGITTAVTTTNHSTGFLVNSSTAATNVYHGSLVLSLEDSTNNVWAISGSLGLSDSAGTSVVAGTKTLSAELTQLTLTTVNGSDTFDAGAINVTYE